MNTAAGCECRPSNHLLFRESRGQQGWLKEAAVGCAQPKGSAVIAHDARFEAFLLDVAVNRAVSADADDVEAATGHEFPGALRGMIVVKRYQRFGNILRTPDLGRD
jgi:hypothetical protein